MTIKIYNTKETLVNSIQRKPPIIWNGQDNKGNLLPSGLYFLKLATKESQEIKKVLLIR